jgi:hypothetical protein
VSKLSALKAKGKITSFDQLKTTLGDSQLENLKKQIMDTSPLERGYLLATPAEKTKLHDKIMGVTQPPKTGPSKM